MPGYLVIGFDGSGCAKSALEQTIALAKELDDEVVVVFGYEPYRMGGEIQDHRAALEERGNRVGNAAVDRVRSQGVKVQLRLVDTEAPQALVAVADEFDARMVIVGTYGDSPLKGAILGSTPHKLMHLCKRPLLVVHDDG